MLSRDQFARLVPKLTQPGGGFTVDVKTGRHASMGWATSEAGHEQSRRIAEYGPRTIERYARQNERLLGQRGRHLGGWEDSGLGYLDVSRVFPETHEGFGRAMHFAVENNQKAMMRLSDFTEAQNPGWMARHPDQPRRAERKNW